jgi:hypothetical protein
MKWFIVIALAAPHISTIAAPDAVICDSLLKATSEQEMSARHAYFLSKPQEALPRLENAVEAFESYDRTCGIDRPMSYIGLLLYGRLAITHQKLGNNVAAEAATSAALK